MSYPLGEVILPLPEQFGFCEGVVSADELMKQVADTARTHGIDTIYGFHHIVHNATVTQEHEANGVNFVEKLEEIPEGSIVVTSAHGVGPEVTHALQQKGCEHFDAACPLVIHTHRGIQMARRNNEKVIYIGHGKPKQGTKLHDEIVGAIGHMDYELVDGVLVYAPVERVFVELQDQPSANLLSDGAKYRIISQTTLDAEACLQYRQTLADYLKTQQTAEVNMSRPGDVCRAVRNRQIGVAALLSHKPDRLVVVTDPTSANGKSYVDLGRQIVAREDLKTQIIAVSNPEDVALLPKDGVTAITASASTPDEVTHAVAVAYGADPRVAMPERPGFRLEDANPIDIKRRIADFVMILLTDRVIDRLNTGDCL